MRRRPSLRRRAASLVPVLAIAGRALAQGGPPMITDDPDTPGDGRWELNLAASASELGGQRLLALPHFDFNYGWGERLQLKLEGGLAAAAAAGGAWQGGADDALLGVKWRFFDGGERAWHVSTYPQLLLQTSPHTVQVGAAEPTPQWLLPLEVSRDFGGFSVVADGAYLQQPQGGNQWLGGVLGALQVDPVLELMGELRVNQEVNGGRRDLLLNLGLRHALAPGTQLLLAAGSGVSTQIVPTHLTLYLGVQLTGGAAP